MVYVITNNKIEDSNKTKVFVKVESKNLHNSLKFFIISLQVLGLLPVKNVTKSYNKIVFKWKCWKNLITLVMMILTSFAVCTCFYVWSDYGYVFSDLGKSLRIKSLFERGNQYFISGGTRIFPRRVLQRFFVKLYYLRYFNLERIFKV